jgi:hypothetical protein
MPEITFEVGAVEVADLSNEDAAALNEALAEVVEKYLNERPVITIKKDGVILPN